MSSNVIRFPGASLPDDSQPGSAEPCPPPDAPPRARGRAPVLAWPWACIAGYLGGIVVTIVLVNQGGTRHLGFDVAAFAALAAVIGWFSRPLGGASAAVIAWLFFDGFLVGRHAQLSWHGTSDAWRLGLLAAIAILASVTRAIATWLGGRDPLR